jgi:hypothetical protein
MSTSAETRVQIRAGHSCFRGLTWDCELGPGGGHAAIIDTLIAQGFVDESRGALIRELVHPDEHRVVFIPNTGRVQLRLHYLTPAAERPVIAQRFAALLMSALETRTGESPAS